MPCLTDTTPVHAARQPPQPGAGRTSTSSAPTEGYGLALASIVPSPRPARWSWWLPHVARTPRPA